MTIIQIGDVVLYALSADNAECINRRYEDAAANRETFKEHKWGYQAHIGNRVVPGEVIPVIITKVWPNDLINGKAILDGNDTLWLTSVSMTVPVAGEQAPQGYWFIRPGRFVQ